MAKNEHFTESLTRREMNFDVGDNDFGYVFPQGSVPDIDKIKKCLIIAGGKPTSCALHEYPKSKRGQAKPEYIITLNADPSTIIVIECKSSTKKHQSDALNKPASYAVDGVLYYAKYLKDEYNVIAIAVSGSESSRYKATSLYWKKGTESYVSISKTRDVLHCPNDYIKLLNGEKIARRYSLDEIQTLAIEMNEMLRKVKVTEKNKPILVAGILLGLMDEDFSKEYPSYVSAESITNKLIEAISNVLKKTNVKEENKETIQRAFQGIRDNKKLMEFPLHTDGSIRWYIEELDSKIKPMMNESAHTIDALGIFYHEFVKYSGGDGKGLGIVLTPQHLTEFMCEVAGVNKNSKVVDICCGSAAFLVTAMAKMCKDATKQEVEDIKSSNLYGVELDSSLYALSIANMIVRQDGKSNILYGDCFNNETITELKTKNLTIGLINPPYGQEDEELEFLETLLSILQPNGVGVIVCPMSCAIGTRFYDTRERLLRDHTLDAVFSMPSDIFYRPKGESPDVCVMVWKAHIPHDSKYETFFGYYRDDGFVKRKKIGRVDAFNKWPKIKEDWLALYHNRDIATGLSARKHVSASDEWLCEEYMETDYTQLTRDDFQQTVQDYLSYLVKNGKYDGKSGKLNPSISFDTDAWKYFDVLEVFEPIQSGKYMSANDKSVPGATKTIASGEDNNGWSQNLDADAIFPAGTITVARNGSVGAAYYQEEPYFATDDVRVWTAKKGSLSVFEGLFLCTVIKLERYRFNYGRKWGTARMEKTRLKLPSTKKGEIDWAFMEKFMKSLQYSDRL